MMIHVFDRVGNIMGKGENVFPLFPEGFLQLSFSVEATFLSDVFSPLTSAETCEKSSRWLWKEKFC